MDMAGGMDGAIAADAAIITGGVEVVATTVTDQSKQIVRKIEARSNYVTVLGRA